MADYVPCIVIFSYMCLWDYFKQARDARARSPEPPPCTAASSPPQPSAAGADVPAQCHAHMGTSAMGCSSSVDMATSTRPVESSAIGAEPEIAAQSTEPPLDIGLSAASHVSASDEGASPHCFDGTCPTSDAASLEQTPQAASDAPNPYARFTPAEWVYCPELA